MLYSAAAPVKTPTKKRGPSIAPNRGRPKNAGVWERQNGSYLAVVYRGEALVFAGTWGTWKEAAVARDRAVLYLGFSDQQLNFPGLSKRKGPASPDALTRDAHGRRKSQRAAPTKFRGVTSVGTRGTRWQASIKLRGREALFLGRWATARLAAEAHDRAARHYGLPDRLLNFVERKENLVPASAADIAAEASRSFKKTTTSRFRGVCFYRSRNAWIAYITANDRRVHLGYFVHEEEAAEAYDKAASKLHGRKAKLNFDPVSGEERLARPTCAAVRRQKSAD